MQEMADGLQGVIPNQPDVWVWLGDIAYLDDAQVCYCINVALFFGGSGWFIQSTHYSVNMPLQVGCAATPSAPHCQCESNFMQHPPNQCMAGQFDYALMRMMHQVSICAHRMCICTPCLVDMYVCLPALKNC